MQSDKFFQDFRDFVDEASRVFEDFVSKVDSTQHEEVKIDNPPISRREREELRVLRDKVNQLRTQKLVKEYALNQFYDVIENYLRVEDYDNPELGITRNFACIEALQDHLEEDRQWTDLYQKYSDLEIQYDEISNFLRKLYFVIEDLGTAMTYQTIGQYRTALLSMFTQEFGERTQDPDPQPQSQMCKYCNGHGATGGRDIISDPVIECPFCDGKGID